MNSTIRNYVSRYVVPFYFDYEKDGYYRLCKHFANNPSDNGELGLPKDGQWINAGFWENYKSVKDNQAEMDVYSYLPKIFLDNDNREDVSSLGTSYVYKTNGKLFELECQTVENHIQFYCRDLGLLIFRNGIGFIWYEAEFNRDISAGEYVKLQHDFKELARTHSDSFLRKTGYDKVKKEVVCEPFCMGNWLAKLMCAEELGIRFWAERETNEVDRKIRIPDKALLFQYAFIDKVTDYPIDDFIFRIANGYDEKYNAPNNIDDKIYRPFGNINYYFSKSGMSCVVANMDSNESFFGSQFREKYTRDYFFIYMLLLYQSYSCAHYSRLLTKLPADESAFNKKAEYVEKLESLNEQINLFLVKSVFESVSNVHHQNDVYRYGKKELCIEEDIQSLTVGLEALKDMERDKRDRKVDSALVIFGFMVVISAWIDGLNLVDWFINSNMTVNPWHIGISGIVLALTLYLVFIFLRNRRKK